MFDIPHCKYIQFLTCNMSVGAWKSDSNGVRYGPAMTLGFTSCDSNKNWICYINMKNNVLWLNEYYNSLKAEIMSKTIWQQEFSQTEILCSFFFQIKNIEEKKKLLRKFGSPIKNHWFKNCTMCLTSSKTNKIVC